MDDFLYRDDRAGRRFTLSWPRFRVETPPRVEDEVARLVAEHRIVGVLWGASEFGPRALGHRSIFADPRWDGVKDYLNEHVKHRQWFRPYAPIVLLEKAAEWFEIDVPSPHMLIVADVRADKRAIIPAVTHVDLTARVQTVGPDDSPRVRKTIEAFERMTGVPVLLNTSFNDHGEPIVETPLDAFQCFASTALDALVLGDRLLIKEGR